MTGCAKTDAIKAPTIIYISPPESLMATCNKPKLLGNTWADLVEHTIKLSDELSVCNNRLLAIKRYIDSQNAELNQKANDKDRESNQGRPEPRERPDRPEPRGERATRR